MSQPDNSKKWDAAAERLLNAIASPTTRQVLRETAVQLGIPLWMLMTGLLQKCYDTGEHTAPVLDPSWTFGNPTAKIELGEATCEHCQRHYRPRWVGQKYCDAACGTAANAANRRPDVDLHLVRHPVGQEPEGYAKSTISQSEAHGSGRGREAAQVGAKTPELGAEFGGTDPVADIEREAQASLGA